MGRWSGDTMTAGNHADSTLNITQRAPIPMIAKKPLATFSSKYFFNRNKEVKTLIAFIYFVLLSTHTMAQKNIVNVFFEVDGTQSIYKNGTVKFIKDKDTVSTSIEDKRLVIPASVFQTRTTAIFYIDKYVLKFDSIPVTLNSLSPNWTVGVDKKPFDKKKFRTVVSWKKVQIVYYLKNDDGRTFTVDGCRKSKVIMK